MCSGCSNRQVDMVVSGVAGDSPREEIYRDEETLAFVDIHPANKGQCLVIPKTHYAKVFDMPLELFGAVASVVVRVARRQ